MFGQAAPKSADPGPTGFSIETEMLTYRALESNSEAIGCDIVAWLNGATADFANPPKGAVCNAGGAAPQGKIVLMPFDRTLLANFSVWRADMATMLRLESVAEELKTAAGGCTVSSQPKSGNVARAATSSVGSLLSGTPAGPPLALAQTVFSMLASDHTASSVAGTVKDQAFMDGIARELRSLRAQVVLPSSYAPGTMATLDEHKSPFLNNRLKTLKARQCLATLAAGLQGENQAEVEQTIAEIDAFLVSMGEAAPPAAKQTKAVATAEPAPAIPAPPAGPTNAPSPAAPVVAARGAQSGPPQAEQGAGATGGSSAPPPVAPSAAALAAHLAAVLEADGMAQLLGVDPDSGEMPDKPQNHILLIQALESGGTVERSTNVLGSKYRYSGGSVGTYALFSPAGDLECSGNVYDYAGSLSSKKFGQSLQGYKPNPQRQMIFLHSCSGVKQGIQ